MKSLTLHGNIFPPVLPDESLFSLVTRIHLLSCAISVKESLQELFGTQNVFPSTGLPTQLGFLHSRLGSVYGFREWSVWADKLTLYPYFSAFISPHQNRRLLHRMQFRNGGLKTELGLLSSGVPAHDTLRYCETCCKTDFNQFGSTYWHRIHQLPMVSACAIHGRTLVKASEESRLRLYLPPYEPEAGLPTTNIANALPTELRFAKISGQLLERGRTLIEGNPRSAYRRGLANRGLMTSGGSVRQRELARMFLACFAPTSRTMAAERITRLDSEEGLPWIKALTRRARGAVHPVFHLLLISVLFDEIDQLNTSPEKLRKPPDKQERPYSDRDYEVAIRKASSLTAAAHSLGISVTTARVIAERLGISFGRRPKSISEHIRQSIHIALRQGKRIDAIALAHNVSVVSVYRALAGAPEVAQARAACLRRTLTRRNRRLFTALASKCPGSGISTVRRAAPALFAWLYRHDQVWLKDQAKQMRWPRPLARVARVDWHRRDLRQVRLVIAAARRILESEGKPIRVTSASIARALGRRDIGRRLSKMPLTRVALGKLIESQADFDKRRIHWSVGVLILKELSLDRSRILRLAGIRHQRWRQHLGTIANEVALQTGARHAFRQQVASL